MIDDFTLDLDEAIEQADILVLCTPTLIAAICCADICPHGGRDDGPVITDVASVKGNLRDAHRGWRAACRRNWCWVTP